MGSLVERWSLRSILTAPRGVSARCMALSVRGRLVALSLAVPAALAIAFFWIRSRTRGEEEEEQVLEQIVDLPRTTLEPLEVQEKLEAVQRQRLFTLEEEKFVVDDEAEFKKEFEMTEELMSEKKVKESGHSEANQ